MKAVSVILLAALLPAGVAVGSQCDCGLCNDGFFFGIDRRFNATFTVEFASGYLASSGALYDTMPVTSQCLEGRLDLGEYGWIEGYGWIISALHDRKHESYRPLFNEFEGGLLYGYDFKLNEKVKFHSVFGPIWNPQIGARESHNSYWGLYFTESIENPLLVPFMSSLWMQEPYQRSRIRFGVRRRFMLYDGLSVTPSIESIWYDRHRYTARYGENPRRDFLHGAFTMAVAGLRFDWKASENLNFFMRIRQTDVIDLQARKATKKMTSYYARCDWPIIGIGFEYGF